MPDRITPIIRHATASDAALLAELGARTFADTFAIDNKPEDMATYLAASFSEEQIQSELSDSRCTFLIAQIHTQPAGYALLRTGDAPKEISHTNSIEIVRFYVSREWHGLGIADALMNACISKAQQSGYETMWLGVWERNARAQAFYKRWDFANVGTHTFELGSDLQNDILMERSVTRD
ncbi:MAG TPA: GNAT family N-acetyltransferase [Pyrinomonadaceae bacterium]